MIVSAWAPARVSLFGGSTDLSVYAREYGGAVINMAINLYSRIILYSGDDLFTTENIFPPHADPVLLYTILNHYGISGMHHIKFKSSFEGFIGAGLGSSASCAVAAIAAINKLQDLGLSKPMIAQKAYELEVDKLGWYGGKQDQWAATYGGLNYIQFNSTIKLTPLTNLREQQLLDSMVLFYLGGSRKSRDIQQGLKTLTPKQVQSLHYIKTSVSEALVYYSLGDIESLGVLMDSCWKRKKQSNDGVSTPDIDDLYDFARKHGAYGGKILGAGGAGYMLVLVPFEKRKQLLTKMKEKHIENIDFGMDLNGVCARIL